MPIYEVTVTKEATYYIEAASEEEARATADELNYYCGGIGGPEWDSDYSVQELVYSYPLLDEWVWRGGPGGDWDD